jgi:hypothetical protein
MAVIDGEVRAEVTSTSTQVQYELAFDELLVEMIALLAPSTHLTNVILLPTSYTTHFQFNGAS